MKVLNQTRGTCVAQHVRIADTFPTRLLGLMGRRRFGDSDGLLISPTNSIHTCFMRFPIDVVFLSKEQRVVAVRTALRPWRATRLILGAHYALELPVFTIQHSRISVGDLLGWVISHTDK